MFLLAASLLALPAIAPPDASRIARNYRTRHEREIVTEFMDLLSIPNLASDIPNIEKNASAIAAMLERRGAQVRLLRLEGVPPFVFATRPSRKAKTSIWFFTHFDGQQLDPDCMHTPP